MPEPCPAVDAFILPPLTVTVPVQYGPIPFPSMRAYFSTAKLLMPPLAVTVPPLMVMLPSRPVEIALLAALAMTVPPLMVTLPPYPEQQLPIPTLKAVIAVPFVIASVRTMPPLMVMLPPSLFSEENPLESTPA